MLVMFRSCLMGTLVLPVVSKLNYHRAGAVQVKFNTFLDTPDVLYNSAGTLVNKEMTARLLFKQIQTHPSYTDKFKCNLKEKKEAYGSDFLSDLHSQSQSTPAQSSVLSETVNFSLCNF